MRSTFPAILLLLCHTASAAAAEADGALVVGARYHMVHLEGRPATHLGGLAAGIEWGLSDFWSIQALLSGDAGASLGGPAAAGGTAGVQIAALIDATQWIPAVAAGVRGGILDSGLEGRVDGYLDLYGGAGLDWRPTRSWSLGVFGFGGLTWSAPGFGASAGALFTCKVWLAP